MLTQLMAVHNGEATIEKAVRSVLLQNLPEGLRQELIICVDDDHMERYRSMLRPYEGSGTLKFVSTVRPKSGPGAARNAGLRVARGDFITIIDCDDWVAGDRLNTRVLEHLSRGEVVVDNTVHVDGSGAIASYTTFYDRKEPAYLTLGDYNNYAQCITPIFPIARMPSSGWDCAMTFAEDLLLYGQIIGDGDFWFEPKPGYYHEIGGVSLSSNRSDDYFMEQFRTLLHKTMFVEMAPRARQAILDRCTRMLAMGMIYRDGKQKHQTYHTFWERLGVDARKQTPDLDRLSQIARRANISTPALMLRSESTLAWALRTAQEATPAR